MTHNRMICCKLKWVLNTPCILRPVMYTPDIYRAFLRQIYGKLSVIKVLIQAMDEIQGPVVIIALPSAGYSAHVDLLILKVMINHSIRKTILGGVSLHKWLVIDISIWRNFKVSSTFFLWIQRKIK